VEPGQQSGIETMKGPGIRYDIDVRRVWECPACGNRMKFLGNITAHRCSCSAKEWMRLIIERSDREFPVRDKIVIPEEEYVEPVEETPETEPATEASEAVSESAVETAPPPREEKTQPKESSNKPETPTVQAEQQSPEHSDTPKPESSKPQPSSSDDDDAFGENIFDD
jgi:hypothetical protein